MKKFILLFVFSLLLVGCEETQDSTMTAEDYVRENNETYQDQDFFMKRDFFAAYIVEENGETKILIENELESDYEITFTCGEVTVSTEIENTFQFVDLSNCEVELLEYTITSTVYEDVTGVVSTLRYLYNDEELEEMYEYEDYTHLSNFSDITTQVGNYYVYIYSPTCSACQTAKYDVLHVMQDRTDTFLVDISAASGTLSEVVILDTDSSELSITAVPTLLLFEDGVATEFIVGSYEIIEYLYSLD